MGGWFLKVGIRLGEGAGWGLFIGKVLGGWGVNWIEDGNGGGVLPFHGDVGEWRRVAGGEVCVREREVYSIGGLTGCSFFKVFFFGQAVCRL